MPRHYGRRVRRVLPVALAFALVMLCLPSEGACEGSSQGYGAIFSYDGCLDTGDRGQAVTALQEVLDSLGYGTSVDGIFGPGTRSSLSEFQGDQGLEPDGVAGPGTIGALSREYDRLNPPDTYTVRSGDTLSAIGDRFGVDLATLVKINHLADGDFIFEGQALLIQGAAGQAESEGAPEPLPPPKQPLPYRRICLSFDDGPDISTTRPLLAILDTYGVKATFFVIGARASKNPDLVREIVAAGHVVGVHGFDHKVLAGLSASEVRKDLVKAQETISAITGQKPWLYRPPFGLLDQTQRAEAGKLGLTVLMWTNIGGADLGARSAADVVERVTAMARDGCVILLHEGLRNTVEALPSLIETLARLGFGFQNVSSSSAATR